MSDQASFSGVIPLSERLQAQPVDPQLSSPLFNGRIPAEIRTMIFKYAVTEFLDPNGLVLPIETFQIQHSHDPVPASDFTSQYLSTDFGTRIQKAYLPAAPEPRGDYRNRGLREVRDGYDWLRFDHAHAMKPSVSLLFTCRRVYLETHQLSLEQAEKRIYCMNGPRFLEDPDRARHLPDKHNAVRFMRLYMQQFYLEDTRLEQLMRFSNLEQLRITIRRTDWWNWESNASLRINPWRGNSQNVRNVAYMHQAMANPTDFPNFAKDAWGTAFAKFPKLKSLTMDFEATQDERSEMDVIVAWATTWKLPLSNARHLSAEGRPIKKLSWRGFPYHNSDVCSLCHVHSRVGRRRSCPRCIVRVQLAERGYGPQLLVWTVSWVAVPDTLP
ncbi:hypothetical protein F5Y18DRAFT_307331 [Xylariaceae sp. FL1019]|nr:hypothetical protein F5Y18DRAFT_307331 [Xylariaceae sp. FL1019]